MAAVTRKTNETDIHATLNLDGQGLYEIDTGIGFLDHMLQQLSRHSLIDLQVKAKGDLHIDFHHTTEDSGYAIGEAFRRHLVIVKVFNAMAMPIFPWMKPSPRCG